MAIHLLAAVENDVMVAGIQTILARQQSVEVLTALDLKSALEAATQLQPSLIVVSDRLDPDYDVFALTELLYEAAPTTRLMIIGRSQNGSTILDLLGRGVSGYFYWYDALETCLPRAIDSVLRNRPYLSQTAQAEYLIAARQPELNWKMTPQACSILSQMAEGRHVKEIALRESLTVRQVYGIQRRLRNRFGAMTTAQLLIRAAEEGFIRLIG